MEGEGVVGRGSGGKREWWSGRGERGVGSGGGEGGNEGRGNLIVVHGGWLCPGVLVVWG